MNKCNNNAAILLVDDEKSIRDTFRIFFEDLGYNVKTADDGAIALEYIEAEPVDVLITDLKMPKMNGMELLERVTYINNTIQVIFISAYEDIKYAVEAIKKGAFDYIGKSFSMDELLVVVEKAVERKRLIEENRNLKEQIKNNFRYYGIIGKSRKMQNLLSNIDKFANSKATVLITGESGVGKEIFAHLIHKRSGRKDENFVIINCGAIPENLIESELFGYEKGSFTGAGQLKAGKFEQAHRGTIFLDEIGELPLHLQVKFLRVLQEKQVQRIGSIENINIDVRVIAATNKDLAEEVRKGSFREDLFYRLNVINMEIPPLRERKEDIPLLAEYFLEQFSSEYGKGLKMIDIEAMNFLLQQKWEGNIRELRNVIERAVAIADEKDEVLSMKYLPGDMLESNIETSSTKDNYSTIRELEKTLIMNTLRKVGCNKSKAAEYLGIKRQTLYNKLKEYDIKL